MNLEFYQDMQKRIPTISLMGEFFSQLKSKSISLNTYGLVQTDAQIMMIFFVLRFVMERSLQELPCTLSDIGRAILDINADTFHLPLDEETAHQLASLIISDIFCNMGEPIVFDPLPEQKEYRYYPRYISSEVIYDEGGNREVSFKMDDDGFKLMLSTREMEENMEIKISSIIFNLKLKAQDYKGALAEIQHSLQLIKIRQLAIEEKILQVRSNALSVTVNDYKKQFSETYDLLNETRESFLSREKGLDMQISEFLANPGQLDDNPKERENLELLEKIKDQLDQALVVFAKVMTALLDFSNEYSEQNLFQLRASSRSRYSYNQMLYDKVLQCPDLLAEVDLFIHPLLQKKPAQQFHLSHAFRYRKLLSTNENEEREFVEEGVDLSRIEAERTAARIKNEQLDQSMALMIAALMDRPDKTLNLADFYQQLPEGFLPTLDEAREFFSYWSALDEIGLEQLAKESQSMIFDDTSQFQFAYALAVELNKYPALQAYNRLEIAKVPGTVVHTYTEGSMQLTFTMDNLEIKLKGALHD